MRKTVDTMEINMFISVLTTQAGLQPYENTDLTSWEPPGESIPFWVPSKCTSGNKGSRIKPFSIALIF